MMKNEPELLQRLKQKMEVEQTERQKAILQQKTLNFNTKNEQIILQKSKLEASGRMSAGNK